MDKLSFFSQNTAMQVKQTHKIRFISPLILEYSPDRNLLSFHPLYWNPCMTDGQTFHFIPHIGIYAIKTDKLRFISSLILEFTYNRRTGISFHHSYWDQRMTDGQTSHFTTHIVLSYRRTNYDSFHPQIEIYTRQTDKLRFISSLILESK